MLSVIVPTRNRAGMLAAALESLTRQSLPIDEFEVVVVDNGSTDGTPRVIEMYASRLTNLRCLHEVEPGLHVGRHAGMKAARGDILVYADDDIEAFPSWLEALAEVFSDPAVGLAGGNNVPMFLGDPPDWIEKMWRPDSRGVRSIPALSVIALPMERGKISPGLVWGCNFAIRKCVLEAAGGFHPDSMPKERMRYRGDGETYVSRYVAALGIKCEFHAGASVHHKVPPERMTLAYFRARGFNQGVSDSYTALRRQSLPTALGLPGIGRRVLARVAREVRGVFADGEVKAAFRQMKLGHAQGIAFHRVAYRDDPAVRDWVHRSFYW